MGITTKLQLQGFYVSVLAVAIAGCGGGGGDSTASGTNNSSAVTTPVELAKSAAALIATKEVFAHLMSHGGKKIVFNTTGAIGTTTVPCNASVGAPTYSIVIAATDTILNYATDCPDGEFIAHGKYVVTPTSTTGSFTGTAEATNFMFGLITNNFNPTINGTEDSTFISNIHKDVYTGTAKLEQNGLTTTFSLPDGLISNVPSGGGSQTLTGKVIVSGGNAFNCVTDGELGFQTTDSLISAVSGVAHVSGTLKVTTGSTAVNAGTVTFNADGSIKVRLTGSTTDTTISKSDFESYCGLSKIADWETKLGTN